MVMIFHSEPQIVFWTDDWLLRHEYGIMEGKGECQIPYVFLRAPKMNGVAKKCGKGEYPLKLCVFREKLKPSASAYRLLV